MRNVAITINPSGLLNEEQKKVFLTFLTTQNKPTLLLANIPYFLQNKTKNSAGTTNYRLTFTHNLLPTNHNENKTSYQVFNFAQPLGAGIYSIVFKTAGKLKITVPDNIEFKSSKYVIKLQRCVNDLDDGDDVAFAAYLPQLFANALTVQLQTFTIAENIPRSMLNNEYKITTELGMKIKPPYFVKLNEQLANVFIPLEYIPGRSLFNVIEDDYNGTKFLATATRIELMLKIFQEYERFAIKNILHRDLKPENILVNIDDATGKVLSCRIIDFNFSKHASDKTTTICGSPDYLSPEVLSGKYSVKSDIFALGKIIAMLWRVTPVFSNNYSQAFYNALYKLDGLFQDIKDLPKVDEELIAKTISATLNKQPDARPMIEELISFALTVQKNFITASQKVMPDKLLAAAQSTSFFAQRGISKDNSMPNLTKASLRT